MTAQPRFVNSATRRVLISGGLSVGGPQTHITLLCRVLREAGVEVTVATVSTNWTRPALAELRATGVRLVVTPFRYGPWQVLGKLWAFLTWPFLLRRDYEVLYCIGEGRMHLWTSRFLATKGFKIYHEIVECPRPGSVAARVAMTMDGIVANSARVGTLMQALLPDQPVRNLPFFTTAAPTTAPTTRPGRGDQPLRLAFLGRLVPHKRPLELIEYLARLQPDSPLFPARLDLYGGDHDGEGKRLREAIGRHRLEDRVTLHGAYRPEDLPRIFAETDLVVLPSIYEGLPLVLVEAMLHGVPVVATSAGGTAELGEGNPNVIITPGTGWDEFEAGLWAMAARVRTGEIDAQRLHAWTEDRYGYTRVAAAWRRALLEPASFFVLPQAVEAAA